ncbi:MAG: uracil-DNA glycosylase, partial [Nitrosarchaeum sp.]|nr:uracil-DNA glycosylase [Nitrosarchaeum sp.]
IKPKIICILGNTAFNSILGGSEITKYRGKIVKKDEQFYFLTVHPAATIYNQELITVLKEDITKLFDLIRELKNGKQILADIDYSA